MESFENTSLERLVNNRKLFWEVITSGSGLNVGFYFYRNVQIEFVRFSENSF